MSDTILKLANLIPLLLSLTVHEWAHAYSAMRLGDDTAQRLGRLSLNPIVHIDPIGTLLLPLINVLSPVPVIPFAWAKPVPVEPTRFRRDVNMSTGMALTAAAGPLSNIVLAVACAVVLGLLLRFAPDVGRQRGVGELLLYMVELNAALAVFNLLPLPPLDGSRILERFVPARLQGLWGQFTQIAPLLLVALFVGGAFILSGPITAVNRAMFSIIRTIAQ